MKVVIAMPVSEILDRISICLLKMQFAPADEQRQFSAVVDELTKGIPSIKGDVELEERASFLYNALKAVNRQIWGAEDTIRTGAADANPDYERIASDALFVRDLNRQRCDIKRQLNEIYKDGWPEVKHNYGAPK
jgi:hypothetical protein